MEEERKVKKISTSETYSLRWSELRQGLPIEDCYFANDDHPETFHLGCFVGEQLASIGSFYKDNTKRFCVNESYQLRGMATLQEFQGKGLGLGTRIIEKAFDILLQNHIEVLWCNARASAVGFYKKMGFEINSEEFEIPGVGPHYVMSKKVS